VDRLVTFNSVAKCEGWAAAELRLRQSSRGRWGDQRRPASVLQRQGAVRVLEAAFERRRRAKRSMIRVQLKDGRPLHHETKPWPSRSRQGPGPSGAGRVTEITREGPMRAVFDIAGRRRCRGEIARHFQPQTTWCAATFDALKSQQSAPHGRAAARAQRRAIIARPRRIAQGRTSPCGEHGQ